MSETEQSDDGELAEAVERVLASLDEQRSKRGLTTPVPTKADRRAVTALYRRLVGQGAQWPTVAMVDALDFAMHGDWWPKRIRTGRSLARHWNELVDDMILADGRTDGVQAGRNDPEPDVTAQPWLPDWAVETLAELDDHDSATGMEVAP